LPPEIMNFEPSVALIGGEDGLNVIRQLLNQTQEKICPGGCLLLEIGYGQKEPITSLINGHFPQGNVAIIPDLAGIERIARITL
jgi:release factor glutamine methyltransferase